jgi:hypothetical protein
MVISKPEDHQERTVMRLGRADGEVGDERDDGGGDDGGMPCMKKKGMTGMMAPTAVESAPELAETRGFEALLQRSRGARWRGRGEAARGRWRCG